LVPGTGLRHFPLAATNAVPFSLTAQRDYERFA
jgi:hypothetical protein